MSLRVVFMGTPAFSVPTLSRILSDGHDVAAVYSQPPRAAGRRGLEAHKSPVHAFADSHAIEHNSRIAFDASVGQTCTSNEMTNQRSVAETDAL